LIWDKAALEKVRNKYGEDLLLPTTLKNWKSRKDENGALIPLSAIEGMVLGVACRESSFLQDGGETPPPSPQANQEPLDEDLRDVPKSIRREHPGAVRSSCMWARKMWNILNLEILTEEPDLVVGTIWRFWEGVTLLRTRQSSGLVHGSQFEVPPAASQLPQWVRQEKIPSDSAGILTTNPANGTILFSQEVLQPADTSTPSDGESFGYKFSAPWIFAEGPEKNIEHEVFGGQSCIPCETVEFLVSLPSDCLEFDAAWPCLRAFSFAPIPSLSRLDYFRQVVEKGRHRGTLDEERQKNALNAIWAHHNPKVAEMIVNAETLQAPPLLKETIGSLFSAEKRVFLARFETPNPLTSQAVCWKSPRK